VQSVIETPRVHAWIEALARRFPVGVEQIIDTVQDLSKLAISRAGELAGGFVTHFPAMGLGFIIVVGGTRERYGPCLMSQENLNVDNAGGIVYVTGTLIALRKKR
jgi:hypothetical protein